MWWQQEIDLEEDNDGANGRGRGGGFRHLFNNEVGNEVDADQGHGLITRDHGKHFMDRPYAALDDDFAREADLDR